MNDGIQDKEENPGSRNQELSACDVETWSRLAPWSVFKSDLVIRVHHVLTEPTCPNVTIEFELPERAGTRVVASMNGNTVEEAMARAMESARRKLPGLVAKRQADLTRNAATSEGN